MLPRRRRMQNELTKVVFASRQLLVALFTHKLSRPIDDITKLILQVRTIERNCMAAILDLDLIVSVTVANSVKLGQPHLLDLVGNNCGKRIGLH